MPSTVVRLTPSSRRRARLSIAVLTAAAGLLSSVAAQAQLPVSPPAELPGITVEKPEAPTPSSRLQRAPAPSADGAVRTSISPTSLTTPIENLPSSVTVIGAQEIERQQRRTAADLLAAVP